MSQPKNTTAPQIAPGSSYLLQLTKGSRRNLYLSILFGIIAGLCSFIPYVMVFRIIMLLFEADYNADNVFLLGEFAAAAALLHFVFKGLSAALSHISAYRILYEVRKKMANHIGSIHLGFFTDNSLGEIKKILVDDVERLEQFFAHQIPEIVVAIVVPLTVFAYLMTVNIPMALVLLLPIILNFLLQMLALAIAKKPMEGITGLLGRLNSVVMQLVGGMPVMKTFNLTTETYQNYADTIDEYHSLWKYVAIRLTPIAAICKVLIESGIFFTLPLGGFLYLRGSLALGEYIFFAVMSIIFLNSYSNLMNFAQLFSQINAGINRIKQIMELPELKSGSRTLEEKKSYPIEFKQVTFSYGQKEVLRNINICLPAGGVTAFVGASGTGKSTAAQLIPRFWDVTGGFIEIAGIPIQDIEHRHLMNKMSFVFQDAFMLNDTIRQNIAIGRTGASLEEIENAAKSAQIHDFIVQLPQGYETHIGESGVKLSGGERQRICIARAILKDAPIIVFDEATSFTDIENEHKIQLALSHLLKGKTTIMIAHRLHTIINADQICVFEDGQISETGNHQTLLALKGRYSDMWTAYTRQQKEEV